MDSLPPEVEELIYGYGEGNECTNMGYLRQESCGPPKFTWCEWSDEYGCEDKDLDTAKANDLKIIDLKANDLKDDEENKADDEKVK